MQVNNPGRTVWLAVKFRDSGMYVVPGLTLIFSGNDAARSNRVFLLLKIRPDYGSSMDIVFFLNNILLGIGLAMDAVSVSVVSGLKEPEMKRRRMALIAAVFGGFQFLMPLSGWLFVVFLESVFTVIRPFIPWVAALILSFLGVRMIVEAFQSGEESKGVGIGMGALLLQGVATSIDALSAGLTMSEYDLMKALVSSGIIGAVTFGLCLVSVFLGRKIGAKLKNKASLVGGVILIAIGLEILAKSLFGQ